MHHSIAIDGPSGAGKSTLARKLSEALGFLYLDTGAIYRTVGLYASRQGIAQDDLTALEACFDAMALSIHHIGGVQHMYLGQDDVTDAIRTPDMSVWATVVAGYPPVRALLLDTQRNFAQHNSVVMDGRDIGTVVLPNATLKIFLTASVEERARRRFLELETRGTDTTYEEVLSEMEARDHINRTREISPEIPADDEVIFDTTQLDFDASLQGLIDLANKHLPSHLPGGDA